MADVDINKFRASVVRDGSKPASPGFIVSEGQDPVDPAGTGQNHLPVTIAAAATGLSITESQVLGGAGTTLQYLRGDASLATFPDLTGYVPYTGANQTVNLNTQQLQAGHTTLTTNGSTETLTINHTSGSGKAINVTKGGNGEGLYVNKTSGSGNAATIVGTLEATTLVKTGGTSSQFLKADGSVDSSTYGTGTVTSVGLSSATSGVTIGSTPVTTSGTITLAIATASGSQNGLLSSTDWTTFNSKQNALTNPVTGTGTTNYLPKFTGASTVGNSIVFDNGTNVGINTNIPSQVLEVNGTGLFTGGSLTGNTKNGVYIFDSNIVSLAGSLGRDLAIQAQNLYFFTGTTYGEKMRIFSDGNVLIQNGGTFTNNGARLQVSGNGNTAVNVSGNGYSVFTGSAFSYTPNNIGFSLGYNRSGGNGESTIVWGAPAAGYNFEIASVTSGTITPRLTIASTGAATFSSTINSGDITVNGNYKGLYFNGTRNAILGNAALEEIYLATANVTRVTITSSGNMGIGTLNPSDKLHVIGNALFNNSSFGTANIRLLGVGTSTGFDLQNSSNDAYLWNRDGGNMYFGNNNTERMRITSSGYLKASNTGTYSSSTGPYHEMINNVFDDWATIIRNTSASPYGLQISYAASPNSTANQFIWCPDGTALRFEVRSNGDVRNFNNSYGSLSDIKLKENIQDATAKLDDLLKVKIRNYNLIGDDKKQIGVIAQELEEVFPNMVDEVEDFEEVEVPQLDKQGNRILNEEGKEIFTKERVKKGTTTKSVKYSVFVPMLIKAIQELKQEIDTLKN